MALAGGDKVRKLGHTDLREYTIDVISPNGDVKLIETQEWIWQGHLEPVVKASSYRYWQCECGAESVGSKRHSFWCMKYNKW